MKRVLIDWRVCQYNAERGIQRYSRNLFSELINMMPETQFFFLLSRRSGAARLPQGISAANIVWFEEGYCPEIDCFFIAHYFDYNAGSVERPLGYMLPDAVMRWRPRIFGVLFDLIPLIWPDRYLKREFEKWLYVWGAQAAHLAHHNFAISECTRSDYIRIIGLEAARISVLPGGVEAERWRRVAEMDVAIENQILFIAAEDFRKNIELCIRGFADFARYSLELRQRIDPVKLVIAGHLPKSRQDQIAEFLKECDLPRASVEFVGAVSDDQLDLIVAASRASIFPSLYEGLGLPILESYAAGKPVFASDRSATRELTHPDCRLDPTDQRSIALAFNMAFNSPGVCRNSVVFGAELLKKIGWPQSAEIVKTQLTAD